MLLWMVTLQVKSCQLWILIDIFWVYWHFSYCPVFPASVCPWDCPYGLQNPRLVLSQYTLSLVIKSSDDLPVWLGEEKARDWPHSLRWSSRPLAGMAMFLYPYLTDRAMSQLNRSVNPLPVRVPKPWHLELRWLLESGNAPASVARLMELWEGVLLGWAFSSPGETPKLQCLAGGLGKVERGWLGRALSAYFF